MWKSLTDFDKGWVIAFLDGEGSFLPHRVGNYIYPRITAVQKESELLERLVKMFGGSISKGNQLCHTWFMDANNKVLVLMIEMFPFMSRKRQKQIEKVLSIWEHLNQSDRRGWPKGKPRKSFKVEIN